MIVTSIIWAFVIFFGFMIAWDIVARWTNRRDQKRQAQRNKEHAEYLASLPEPDPLPPPWISMDEEYVLDTTWGPWYDNCLETVNETATERSYYFVNKGWLLFRNEKLVQIKEWQ